MIMVFQYHHLNHHTLFSTLIWEGTATQSLGTSLHGWKFVNPVPKQLSMEQLEVANECKTFEP